MTTTSSHQVPDYVLEDRLHPIATQAAEKFLAGNGTFSKEVLKDLARSLGALRDDVALGPAVASLVKLAAHIENDLGAPKSARQLLAIAMMMTGALEQQNQIAQRAKADADRNKGKRFQKFLGN